VLCGSRRAGVEAVACACMDANTTTRHVLALVACACTHTHTRTHTQPHTHTRAAHNETHTHKGTHLQLDSALCQVWQEHVHQRVARLVGAARGAPRPKHAPAKHVRRAAATGTAAGAAACRCDGAGCALRSTHAQHSTAQHRAARGAARKATNAPVVCGGGQQHDLFAALQHIQPGGRAPRGEAEVCVAALQWRQAQAATDAAAGAGAAEGSWPAGDAATRDTERAGTPAQPQTHTHTHHTGAAPRQHPPVERSAGAASPPR
jgi:hypothetical protein